MSKPKVAFVCVRNACRSQMAEALSRLLAADAFEAFSGGTQIEDRIDGDAVAVILELYGVDMTLTQRPKAIGELPPVDAVIAMGCDVDCPYLPARHREDWALEDPAGKGREAFVKTARAIEEKVLDLMARIGNLA